MYSKRWSSSRLRNQSATAKFIREQIVIILYDPNELAQGFLQNVPLAMVFLLPAFALLVKLIFRRPHRYFVKHLVFALHLHSAAFLVFMLLTPLPRSMDQAAAGDLVESGFYLALQFMAIWLCAGTMTTAPAIRYSAMRCYCSLIGPR